jgi:YfiH family protein
MRLPAPFYRRGHHLAIELPGAQAVFTTRRGGFSTGPYTSLNLGRLTGDSPRAVEQNRAAVAAELGIHLAQTRQVHGAVVRSIVDTDRPRDRLPEADGHITALRGLAPTVLVADCLPIALSGRDAVAMLHAGWRGLAGGIIAEGVRAMRELGTRGPLSAAIGPAAGGCCYQAGEEVHAAFAGYEEEVRRDGNLDLKLIARRQLECAGVQTVHDVRLCTICDDASLLFSHRRDRGVTGRQAGIVWLS